jgi:hypothetical protein
MCIIKKKRCERGFETYPETLPLCLHITLARGYV